MGIKAANNIAKRVALMQDEYFSDYTYKNTRVCHQLSQITMEAI